MWTVLALMLAQGTVLICPDPNCNNCGIDAENNLVCYGCANGLFLFNGQCIPCEHDLVKCQSCGDGLWSCVCNSPSTTSQCGTCPGDCSGCDEISPCLVPPIGSFIDSSGNLQECYDKCSACTSEHWCTECKDDLVPKY